MQDIYIYLFLGFSVGFIIAFVVAWNIVKSKYEIISNSIQNEANIKITSLQNQIENIKNIK